MSDGRCEAFTADGAGVQCLFHAHVRVFVDGNVLLVCGLHARLYIRQGYRAEAL